MKKANGMVQTTIVSERQALGGEKPQRNLFVCSCSPIDGGECMSRETIWMFERQNAEGGWDLIDVRRETE